MSLLSGASLAGNVSSMADLQKHVHEVASRVTAATVALVSDGERRAAASLSLRRA